MRKEVKFRQMLCLMQTVLNSSSSSIFVDKPVYPSILWFYWVKKWRERSKYQIPEGQSETDKGCHKGGNISDDIESVRVISS